MLLIINTFQSFGNYFPEFFYKNRIFIHFPDKERKKYPHPDGISDGGILISYHSFAKLNFYIIFYDLHAFFPAHPVTVQHHIVINGIRPVLPEV